jgi:hypothetical protein
VAELIRVFVDGRAVDVAPGSTILDAIRVADEALGDAVHSGARSVTDSRGLPVAASTPVVAGSIVRTVTARGRA